MEQNYYIKNIHSKFIEVKGRDSAEFLQGLITNDIYKCNNSKNILYSCLLSPQGKFLADFFISKPGNYFLIEIHEKYFETFCNKLNMYKLRSKIEINQNTKLISLIFFNKDISQFSGSFNSFKDPRNNNLGIKIYINSKSSDLKIIDKVKEFNYDFYKEMLIKNLIPNSADDLIEKKSLLLENNFQNINAIDWNKGCYVGQEITARMKYRSLLKKQIYNLELISGDLQIGEKIYLNEINIGEVISKINQYLLCMLKIDLVDKKKLIQENLEINSSIILKFL